MQKEQSVFDENNNSKSTLRFFDGVAGLELNNSSCVSRKRRQTYFQNTIADRKRELREEKRRNVTANCTNFGHGIIGLTRKPPKKNVKRTEHTTRMRTANREMDAYRFLRAHARNRIEPDDQRRHL
jgi:hypothetical protein